MKKSLKIGLIILNIIVFLWSFWGEDVLFFPEYITSSKQVLFYVLTKAVLILLLCAEYYSIISIYENRNVGGGKDFLKYLFILGLVYSVAFAVVHPGIWNGDATGVVYFLRVYSCAGVGQGLLTNCFMAAILSVIPNVSAIVIAQLFIVAGIQAYIATVVKKYSKKRYIANIVVLADMLPLNIIINMFPLRMAIYGHFCILLIVLLWEECWVKRNEATSLTKLLFIGIISGCVASWRFDTIFAFLFSGIFLLLFKKQDWMKRIVSVITPVLVFLGISVLTNVLIPHATTLDDIAKAMCTTLSVMSQEELKGENIESWIRDVDKVIDMDIVAEYPSLWSPAGFEHGAWRNPSGREVLNGLISYLKIVFNNLSNYLNVKWQQFMIVSSWDFYGYEVIDETTVDGGGYGFSTTGIKLEDEVELYHMPMDGVRTYFLKWLYNPTGMNGIDNIVLGVIPAIIAIIIVLFISIIKYKKLKEILVLALFPVFHLTILMSGMAMPWPMYFGPIVLEADIMGAILLATMEIEKQMQQ